MFSTETREEIEALARRNGLEPAALLAVAQVESGGKVYARIGGRREPLIRFEGHYFDRRLSGSRRAKARAEGLAAPSPGVIRNPDGQAARWRLLERAAAIDRKAAYESVSWGLGQVMGAHWAWLGYASADALVERAREGVAGQVELMVRFIRKSGLDAALNARDWAAFARGYNGPAYASNAYDRRMAAAYARLSGGDEAPARTPGTDEARLLRRGARGDAVRDLQTMLAALGYPLARDGIFGPATEAAVRRFQTRRKIAVDGIVGPVTLGHLRDAQPIGSWLAAVAAAIASCFRSPAG